MIQSLNLTKNGMLYYICPNCRNKELYKDAYITLKSDKNIKLSLDKYELKSKCSNCGEFMIRVNEDLIDIIDIILSKNYIVDLKINNDN